MTISNTEQTCHKITQQRSISIETTTPATSTRTFLQHRRLAESIKYIRKPLTANKNSKSFHLHS